MKPGDILIHRGFPGDLLTVTAQPRRNRDADTTEIDGALHGPGGRTITWVYAHHGAEDPEVEFIPAGGPLTGPVPPAPGTSASPGTEPATRRQHPPAGHPGPAPGPAGQRPPAPGTPLALPPGPAPLALPSPGTPAVQLPSRVPCPPGGHWPSRSGFPAARDPTRIRHPASGRPWPCRPPAPQTAACQDPAGGEHHSLEVHVA